MTTRSARPSPAVTVKDIAKAVGIHYTTVAHVLRDPESPKASPKTRAKVLRTAERLGYRGNLLASHLRRGLQGLAVVLSVPHREFVYYPYYQEVLAGLQAALTGEGRTLSVFGATPETQAGLPRLIDASLYSGVVALGPEEYPGLEEVAQRVPTLQVNYRTESPHRAYLMRDEDQAARLSFAKLHAAGCRRIKAVFLYRHAAQAFREKRYRAILPEFKGMALDFDFLRETPRVLYDLAMVRELTGVLTPARLRELTRGCDAILSLSTYGEILHRRLVAEGMKTPAFLMDGMMYVERMYFPEIARVGVPAETIVASILAHFKNPAMGKTILMPSTFHPGTTLPGI